MVETEDRVLFHCQDDRLREPRRDFFQELYSRDARYEEWRLTLDDWPLLGRMLDEDGVLGIIADWGRFTHDLCRQVPVIQINTQADWEAFNAPSP